MTPTEKWTEYYAEALDEFREQEFPVEPTGKAWAVYYHWDKRNNIWQHHDWSALYTKEDKILSGATSFRGGKIFVMQYLKDKGYIPDFAEGYSYQRFAVYTKEGTLSSIAVRDVLDEPRQTVVFDSMSLQYEDETGNHFLGAASTRQAPSLQFPRLESKLGIKVKDGGIMRLLGNFKLSSDRKVVCYPKNNRIRIPATGHVFVEPDLSVEDRRKQVMREKLYEVWQEIREELLHTYPELIFDKEALDARIKAAMSKLRQEGQLDWEKIRHRKGLDSLYRSVRSHSASDNSSDGS